MSLDDLQALKAARRIKTSFVHPPIPIRTMDWTAWFDGNEEGLHGEGATEAEAVQDLLDEEEAGL